MDGIASKDDVPLIKIIPIMLAMPREAKIGAPIANKNPKILTNQIAIVVLSIN
jgi:hypothetical protein